MVRRRPSVLFGQSNYVLRSAEALADGSGVGREGAQVPVVSEPGHARGRLLPRRLRSRCDVSTWGVEPRVGQDASEQRDTEASTSRVVADICSARWESL